VPASITWQGEPSTGYANTFTVSEARGVHQVICRPDWNRHGKAAPFRRNAEMLNLLPKGLILFPSDSGITANLADQAVSVGIPVMKVRP